MDTATQTSQSRPLFSRQALTALILPMLLEQILSVTMGMADTLMVSGVGEAAVSSVSLVDSINVLIIQVLAALATGGAVIGSQYLGRQDGENARKSAAQLYTVLAVSTVSVMAAALLFCRPILRLVFGQIDADVMRFAEQYFIVSAISYPFIGAYNAGAALFRAQGNSRISMLASLVMNVINIGGNAILIFGLDMGVAGAAIASLASRAAAAVMVIRLLLDPHKPVNLADVWRVRIDGGILRSILSVGIPSGMENGTFQIGKLLVAGLVTSFGTTAITANAICNNVGAFSNLPGSAMSLAMITVIGQCIGAGDYDQAKYYVRKLMLVTVIGMAALNVGIFFAAPPLVGMYQASEATYDLALFVLRYNCVCTLWWPPSFALPNALRAAGDAKFTMGVSMVSMWVCRVALSYVLGLWFHLGFFGVWMAMTIDWAVRAVLFVARYRSGKWQNARVI